LIGCHYDRIKQTGGRVGVGVLNILEAKFNFQNNLTFIDRCPSKNGVISDFFFAIFIDRCYISPQLKMMHVKAYIGQ